MDEFEFPGLRDALDEPRSGHRGKGMTMGPGPVWHTAVSHLHGFDVEIEKRDAPATDADAVLQAQHREVRLALFLLSRPGRVPLVLDKAKRAAGGGREHQDKKCRTVTLCVAHCNKRRATLYLYSQVGDKYDVVSRPFP